MAETNPRGAWPEFDVSDRLVKARKFAELEQQELADKIGVHRNTIVNYERGDWQRSRKAMILRAWAYQCKVDPVWIDPSLGDPDTDPTLGINSSGCNVVTLPTGARRSRTSPRLSEVA